MRGMWILALVLSWNGRAQPPVQTSAELEAELERSLRGGTEMVEGPSIPVPGDRPTGISVSVAQLGHEIPRNAQKAFQRANEYTQKGDHARAAAELERATGSDSQFAAAYTNLGVEYGRLRRLDEAVAALRRALELDPHSSITHYDMGIVLLRSGDLSGAEWSARRALQESAENPWAHFLLGWLLSESERTRGEGLRHVEVAARSLPEARQFIQSHKHAQ